MIILEKLLALKHKLPFDGDWLYVTLSTNNEDDEGDIKEDGEIVKEKINNEGLKNNNYQIIKQLNEFANERMVKIEERSKLVREKAKLIWQSAGVIFTVFFTITSLLINNFTHLSFNIKTIIFTLAIFMILHLSRALKVSIDSITRERNIILSSDSLIEIAEESTNESQYLKKITLEKINNSNEKNKFVTSRVNKVIIAQSSLVWGIIYLALILMLIIGSLFFYTNNFNSNPVINNKSNISSSTHNEKIKNRDNMKELNLNFKKDKDIKKPQFSLNKYKLKFDKENGKDIIIKKDKYH